VETFDRDTGELIALDLGLWMTLTEFTTLMGVDMRLGRLVLAEIGLIHTEGHRYRLKPEHEATGLGSRLRAKNEGYPFDVLSPAGQSHARDRWAAAQGTVVARRQGSERHQQAAQALASFAALRSEPLTIQESVCWLLDHFPNLTTRETAAILNVTNAIVFKWSALRSEQRQARLKQRDVVSGGPSKHVGGRGTYTRCLPPRNTSSAAGSPVSKPHLRPSPPPKPDLFPFATPSHPPASPRTPPTA
jgi:hypothetical protein